MNHVMFLLEFLLNNALAMTVIVVGLGLTVYFGRKLYREFRLNQKLRAFQKRLRIIDFLSHKGRRVTIASLIVVPLLVVFAFFQLTLPTPIQYDNHATTLASAEDVLRVYNSYEEKFSPQVNLRDHDAVAQHAVATYEAMNVSLYVNEPTDLVAVDGNFIYQVTNHQLIITEMRGDEEPMAMTLALPLGDQSEFDPVKLLISNDYVVAVGHETTPYDTNTDVIDTHVLTAVFILDLTDVSWDAFHVNGTVEMVDMLNGRLLLSTRHAIDFDHGADHVAAAFPSVTQNEDIVHVVEDAVYIEGTKPTMFVALHAITLLSGDVDSQAVLTSESTVVKVDDAAFYLFSSSYKFYDATEMFVMSDPIEYVRTAITAFEHLAAISYQGTTMVRGVLPGVASLDVQDGLIRLLTTENASGGVRNRVFVLDSALDVLGSITEDEAMLGSFETMQFYNDTAYLYPSQSTDDIMLIDFTDVENPEALALHISEALPKTLLPLQAGYALSVAYADTNQNGFLDGLRLCVYDMHDPAEPVRLHTTTVSLAEYQYMTRHLRLIPYVFVYSEAQGLLTLPMNSYEATGQTTIKEGVLVMVLSMEDGFTGHQFFDYTYLTKRHNANRAIFHDDGLYIYTHNKVRIIDAETLDVKHQIPLYEPDE